jgi:hypothetical protein
MGRKEKLDRLTTGLQRLPDPGQQLRSGDCCERDYECCDEVVDHDGRVARLSERTVGHTSKTRHQERPAETGGRNGASIAKFRTRRPAHICETTRYRAVGVDGPLAASWCQSAGWILLIHAGEFVARLAHYMQHLDSDHIRKYAAELCRVAVFGTLNPLTPARLQA